MKIPRSTKESEALLRSLVSERAGVALRPMFGNLSAFVNGNMYAGVFGEDIFVRLSPADGAELLEKEGASHFAPMSGRAMKDYVLVPRAWTRDAAKVRPWMTKALDWTEKMPPKAKKG